jgi:hypothetical protein
MTTDLFFQLEGITFKADDTYDSHGQPLPVFMGTIFSPVSGPETANDSDYQALKVAMDMRLPAKGGHHGNWAIFADGQVLAAFLWAVGVYRYEFKTGAPLHPHMGHYNPMDDAFKAVLAGKVVEKRELSSDETTALIDLWQLPEEDLWRKVLELNKTVQYVECPEGHEFEYAEAATRGEINAPQMVYRRMGVDSCLNWKRWTLLPPTPEGKVRVVEMHMHWQNPQLHVFDLGTPEADEWLLDFAVNAANSASATSYFGYFCAKAGPTVDTRWFWKGHFWYQGMPEE